MVRSGFKLLWDWIKSKTNHKSHILTPTQRTVGDYCLTSGHLLNDSPPQGENFLDLVWSNAKINDFYVFMWTPGLKVWTWCLQVWTFMFSGMNFHVHKYILNVLKYELTRLQVWTFRIFTSASMEFHTIYLTISGLYIWSSLGSCVPTVPNFVRI